MPFYEINWTKYGTALIEADNEDEAFEYLSHEIDYEEAELENVSDTKPSNTCLYDPVSIEHKY